ncbi:hypothetical protein ABEB36_009328 [Hypothenemus hampei]|uniref:Uncharacterized protein n=1 Tax=Hypothenemus hampei TaxID=57062 RepID=A0ABD1EI41_HYPHA
MLNFLIPVSATERQVHLVRSSTEEKPVPISVEKKEQLMELLEYIPESLWDFYKNIPSTQDEVDILSNISSEEDEDPA